jgi:hypothetical protein
LLGDFWTGLAVVHLLAWVFLGLACVLAPRKWQEPVVVAAAARQSSRRRRRPATTGTRNTQRRQWLEVNPVRWLAAHDPRLRKALWMVLGGLMAVFALLGLTTNDLEVGSGLLQALTYILVLIVKLWLISQASRFFVEATRNGMIELLLATPLPTRQIVRGQVWALRRTFLYPVVLLLCLTVASHCLQFATVRTAAAASGEFLVAQIVSATSSCVLIVTSLLSTTWFAMWMGLVSKKPNIALIKTLVFVEILPWMVISFAQTLIMVGMIFSGLPSWVYHLPTLLLGAGADLIFFAIARHKLLHRFREIVARASGVGAPRRPPPLPRLQAVAAAGAP